MKINRHNLFNILPYTSMALLLFILSLYVFYVPNMTNSASAVDKDLDVNVRVDKTISINASPATVTMGGAAGQFLSGTTSIDVGTNNPTGYELTIEDDETTAPAAIVNESDSSLKFVTVTTSTTEIDGVTTEVGIAPSSFTDNTWGVAIDAANPSTAAYLSVPINGSPKTIKKTDANASTSATGVTFGVKSSAGLPAGTYSSTITFSAITNYVPTTKTLANITTMQEMTPAICDATPASPVNETPTIYYLQDKRGGGYDNSASGTGAAAPLNTDTSGENTYAVAKLADNKCWMLQNLNIAGTTISAADSDFTGDDIALPNNVTFGASNNNTLHAYYVGDSDADRNRHTGAYYNWYTATAKTGTASMTDGQEATSSICPAGWHLPKAGTAANSDTNYFYNLLNRYTIAGKGSWDSSNNRWSGDARDGLANAPLYLPTAGYVYNSAVSSKAINGYYWSSMAQSANNAYALLFNSSFTYPRNYNTKYLGFSVRCVAEPAS